LWGLRWWDTVDATQLSALDTELVSVLDAIPTSSIHFISDELALISEPALKHYIQTQSPRHPRFGWYIIVQPRHKAFARLLSQMACTMLNLRFRIVEDEATAWAFLQRIDPHIVAPVSQNQSSR
ncbi:hypothetical protein HC776_00690, partial [bacterium]|nr:hypothetical protein [bacterium]